MYLNPKVHPEHGREFAIRYYRWALEQWRLEVEQDLPTLRCISDHTATLSLRILERLPPARRLRIGRAIARRLHRDALGFLGERLLPEEEELVENHFQQTQSELIPRIYSMAMERPGPWAALMPHYRPPKVREALRRVVRLAVEPVLGRQEPYRLQPRLWRYRTAVGQWTVLTDIAIGMMDDLAYSHDVRFGDESDSMCRFVSALDWMGYAGPYTGWILSSENDIPTAVAALASLCRRFLDAAQDLLPSDS